ncbi:MAG: hypothetical protein GX587_10255, partial [Bacteroidales bacterium]|nr:hypothetical protein [Bacteroidales bacterium]
MENRKCRVGLLSHNQNVICYFLFTIFFVLFTSCFCSKKPKIYTAETNYKYQQKVLRKQEVEKYQRSLLPESGLMTKQEYEEKSKDIPTEERVIPEYKPPRDLKMKYVPQAKYKLTHYNDPPGSPDLYIGGNFKADKQ